MLLKAMFALPMTEEQRQVWLSSQGGVNDALVTGEHVRVEHLCAQVKSASAAEIPRRYVENAQRELREKLGVVGSA